MTPLRHEGGKGEVARPRILQTRDLLTSPGRDLLTPAEETAPITVETLRTRTQATSGVARKTRDKRLLPPARRRHMRTNAIDAARRSSYQQLADWWEVPTLGNLATPLRNPQPGWWKVVFLL